MLSHRLPDEHSESHPIGWGGCVQPDWARELFLDEALAIADQIIQRQVRTKGGNPTWLGPAGYGTELNPVQLVQLGPHLYDGKLGLAFFLAALGRVTGSSKYADLSWRVLAPLRRSISDLVRDPAAAARLRLPIGALIGIGSFIYSFLKIGEWLGEPSLLREAHDATALITSEKILKDDHVYFQAGSAGAILALLALHEVEPEVNRDGRTPLDIARECGEHLLKTRRNFAGRPKAWLLSSGKPPLIGFSYGAAGISYALLRLSEALSDPKWREAALEGWGYVRSFYRYEERRWTDIRALLQSHLGNPTEGTWRDWWFCESKGEIPLELQERAVSADHEHLKGTTILANKWCHGAAGIAMARIGTLPRLDSSEIRDEISSALEETRSFSDAGIFAAHPADDLCCGHMGRIEALLYASRQLSNESGLREAADTLAYRVIQRAQDRGSYTLSAARGKDYFAPSLFQGHAGIGYTFLRLARPGDLPCLLLLE
jgi:lantibiotic modifying enzyme